MIFFFLKNTIKIIKINIKGKVKLFLIIFMTFYINIYHPLQVSFTVKYLLNME